MLQKSPAVILLLNGDEELFFISVYCIHFIPTGGFLRYNKKLAQQLKI